jgi:hypothetical protein
MRLYCDEKYKTKRIHVMDSRKKYFSLHLHFAWNLLGHDLENVFCLDMTWKVCFRGTSL